MFSTAVLLPGSAAACLPRNCQQSLSQLPSLASWGVKLTNTISSRAISTAVQAQAGVQEAALAADSPTQNLPTFLAELQNRQTGRLRSPILDKHGRIMLKNLTRAELADWFEMQGAPQLHTLWKFGQVAWSDTALTQAYIERQIFGTEHGTAMGV